jgi:hypothetical protein
MDAGNSTAVTTSEMPKAVKVGLWLLLTALGAGAAYLYAVRGNAIILDLSSGIAGLLCL